MSQSNTMKSSTDIGVKFKEKIASRYPAIDSAYMPTDYDKKPIDFRNDDVAKYDVVVWHRLLERVYGKPVEIECQIQMVDYEGQPNIQTTYLLDSSNKCNTPNLSDVGCLEDPFTINNCRIGH
ncbi:MAG: hypothetical protein ACI8PB_000011 [Desulforhopalus sp.]|jgi:hypothetical protein